jgi:hypothetical protein
MLIVLGHELAYFFKHETKGIKGDAENEVISMLEFFIDDNVVEFRGHIFQQIIGFPIGKKYIPLFPDLFLYIYEDEFIKELIKENKIRRSCSVH